MQFESRISRTEFYDKLGRKSGSENTPANAKTALNNFDLFCKHEYNQTLEKVIEEQVTITIKKKDLDKLKKSKIKFELTTVR